MITSRGARGHFQRTVRDRLEALFNTGLADAHSKQVGELRGLRSDAMGRKDRLTQQRQAESA